MAGAADGDRDDRTTHDSPLLSHLGPESVLLSLARALPGHESQGVSPETAADATRRYEIVQLLGEGGMGRVYLVHDRDLKRQVALKVIRGGNSSSLLPRFVEEAQVLGRLEHPNIVPLYEIGMLPERTPYYTMRYVRGRTLADLLARLRDGAPDDDAPSLTRLLNIFMHIGHAVSYAHSMDIVHRDLKPSNVMLGQHGEVQVLDWGLSKLLAPPDSDPGAAVKTVPGQLIGTPRYMAPEQALGRLVDARTDVYSLGVILYEMLALDVPFPSSGVELLVALARDEPTPPSVRAPTRHVPAALEAVCMRALRKQPEDRFQTVTEMLDLVRVWMELDADRARRRARVVERLETARSRLRSARELDDEVARLEARAGERTMDRAERDAVAEQSTVARERLERARFDAVASLLGALEQDPADAEARSLLAGHYWDRFLEAERRRDFEAQRFFGELVATYDDGRRSEQLTGPGWLAVESDPPNASACLHDFVEISSQRQLVPSNPRSIGRTPLGPIELAAGSYLLVLEKPGYYPERFAFYISRKMPVSKTLYLLRE